MEHPDSSYRGLFQFMQLCLLRLSFAPRQIYLLPAVRLIPKICHDDSRHSIFVMRVPRRGSLALTLNNPSNPFSATHASISNASFARQSGQAETAQACVLYYRSSFHVRLPRPAAVHDTPCFRLTIHRDPLYLLARCCRTPNGRLSTSSIVTQAWDAHVVYCKDVLAACLFSLQRRLPHPPE